MLSSAQLRSVYDAALADATAEHVGHARLSVADDNRDRGCALLAVQTAVLAESLVGHARQSLADARRPSILADYTTDESLDRLAAILDQEFDNGASDVVFGSSGEVWACRAGTKTKITGTSISDDDRALWARAARAAHPRFDGDATTPYFQTPAHRTRATFIEVDGDVLVTFRRILEFDEGARIVSIRPMTEEELADVR